MKRILICFFLLVICVSLFAVKYEEGKTLDVYPDTMISGNQFSIQFEPKEKTVVLANYGSANTLMVRGDKTGSSEVAIGPNGVIPYDFMVQLFESNSELYLILAVGKTSLAQAKVINIDGNEFSAKLNKKSSSEYYVGGKGPAGGIIFYDKGEYSDGWRYLEVAPADLRVVTGTPSVDKSDPWYDFGDYVFVFGYYRKSANGDNLFVNNTKTYTYNCTGTAVGTGRKNTELLVKAMGDSAYLQSDGLDTTSYYAAKLCSDLVFNGFDDWFLPSIEELILLYTNRNAIGGLTYTSYWSSSEADYTAWYAYKLYYSGMWANDGYRSSMLNIRPIRSF